MMDEQERKEWAFRESEIQKYVYSWAFYEHFMWMKISRVKFSKFDFNTVNTNK